MKKLGIVISIICAVITAISVLGIVVSNQGKVESVDGDQLRELYQISEMPFPEAPEGEPADPAANHPKSDALVQLMKKKADNTFTGRLRVLEGLTVKYDALELEMVNAGGKRFTPEFNAELEKRFVEDMTSYGVYREITHLSLWEKFCLFAIAYRSVMLIFGFLGMGLGIAIASSSTFESDLDEQK